MIREGSDITLVGWGAQLAVMEQACVDAEKVATFEIFLNLYLWSVLMIHCHES